MFFHEVHSKNRKNVLNAFRANELAILIDRKIWLIDIIQQFGKYFLTLIIDRRFLMTIVRENTWAASDTIEPLFRSFDSFFLQFPIFLSLVAQYTQISRDNFVLQCASRWEIDTIAVVCDYNDRSLERYATAERNVAGNCQVIELEHVRNRSETPKKIFDLKKLKNDSKSEKKIDFFFQRLQCGR